MAVSFEVPRASEYLIRLFDHIYGFDSRSKKSGHHKNLEIHDPTDWNKTSYLRHDIQVDSKEISYIIIRLYTMPRGGVLTTDRFSYILVKTLY